MKEINILELANGAIQDQIDLDVQKVVTNIVNPNTDPAVNRQIIISLVFKSDENRELISCEAKVETVLAPICSKIVVGTGEDKTITAEEIQAEQEGSK